MINMKKLLALLFLSPLVAGEEDRWWENLGIYNNLYDTLIAETFEQREVPAQNQEELILRCPMNDVGLVAIYKINFKNNSVSSSMEGFSASQSYSFALKDNKIFIPPSEFGEEVIDLSNNEVNTRAGYEGSSWKAYKCSET